jgi:hypothetical protein
MKWLFFILIAFFLLSCDKELPFDGFNNEPKVVVQCHFTSDSGVFLKLNYTRDILSDDENIDYIDDAKVRLIDSNGLIRNLNFLSNGMYSSVLFPAAGMDYTMYITLNDGKLITAKSQIPLEEFEFKLDTATGPLNRLDVKVTFDNDINTRQFYILRVMEYSTHFIQNQSNKNQIDSIAGWYATKITSSNNIFESSGNLNASSLNFEMFNDGFFNGQTYSLNLLLDRTNLSKSEFKSVSDSLMVYIKSVPKPCYDYYLGVIKNSNNYGGPFSTNFNPIDNIVNGFGIFSGYRHDAKKIILK